MRGDALIFPKYNTSGTDGSVSITCFDRSKDLDGVASLVPHMDNFYDNSLQSGLMRELAIDLEILGEHPVLLGNQVSMVALQGSFRFNSNHLQGVGKNKIVDR